MSALLVSVDHAPGPVARSRGYFASQITGRTRTPGTYPVVTGW